jgi:hypothetical protein
MHTASNKTEKGSLLIAVMVYAAIGIVTLSAFVGWAVTLSRVADHMPVKEQSLQLAEAGIDYYRWHLAHDPDDYEDGTGEAGPYVHEFTDQQGNRIGEYSLSITPPSAESNRVIIESTGTVDGYPELARTIQVTLTQASLAQYAIVTNNFLRVLQNVDVNGKIHSNYGIRFDGIAHNAVTSAQTSYDDASHADTSVEHAVHTHVKRPPLTGIWSTYVSDEAPPNPLETRTDVFMAGRSVGVPAIDFTGITSDIATLQTQAQSADGDYYAASGYQGYHIVLKTNDTYDIYTVTNMQSAGTCTSGYTPAPLPTGYTWSVWTIKATGGQTLIGNYPFPANGIIYANDNIWVDGTVNGARLTIVSGGSTSRHIVVNTNLSYTNYDGTDVVGLISQGSVITGLRSDDTLRIDAAMVAQSGKVGRYPYGSSGCGTYRNRASLTTYGMIAANASYGFSETDSTSGSGYGTVSANYDSNLMFDPPPGFPSTSDTFMLTSWEEID